MRPIPLLILLCLIALPCAGSATIVPNPGTISGYQTVEISGSSLAVDVTQIDSDAAISNIYVYGVAPGTTVNFSVSRAGGSYSGSYLYQDAGVNANLSLSLGDSSASWEQLSIIKLNAAFCIRYATNSTAASEGIVLSDVPPFNQEQGKYAYLKIPYISNYPITRIQLSTDTGDEVKLVVRYNEAADVAEYVDKYSDAVNVDYLGQLIDFVTSVIGTLAALILIFKFIFLDHFAAVVILYESVMLGYAASQSNGLIPFTQKFVRYNVGFFTILMKFIAFVLDFFYKLIQAIKPI